MLVSCVTPINGRVNVQKGLLSDFHGSFMDYYFVQANLYSIGYGVWRGFPFSKNKNKHPSIVPLWSLPTTLKKACIQEAPFSTIY